MDALARDRWVPGPEVSGGAPASALARLERALTPGWDFVFAARMSGGTWSGAASWPPLVLRWNPWRSRPVSPSTSWIPASARRPASTAEKPVTRDRVTGSSRLGMVRD